jgi:selenocysteine lyase/cysteine desulfurase
VPYAAGGARFLGSTFDPSGLYRFNAAMRWRAEVGLTVERSLAHVHALQRRFVAGLSGVVGGPTALEAHGEHRRSASTHRGPEVELGALVVPIDDPLRGHFLTFRTPNAQAISAALKQLEVDTDARADRLRFGFGVYHDVADVDALLERVRSLR